MDVPRSKLAGLFTRHPLLRGLSKAGQDTLLEHAEPRLYPAGQELIREGQAPTHFWLLLTGSVRVFYRSRDGFEITVKLLGAPAAFGELELLADHPHVEDCVTVDRATVLRVPKALFSRLLDSEPRFSRQLLVDTCARFLITAQHERALAFQSVEERLASLLCAYVRMYGVPVEGGTEIRIPLSHESLASGVAATKKSITRALARWKTARLLDKRGRYYVVRRPDQLAALAAAPGLGVDWVAGSALTRRAEPLPPR